MEQYIDKAALVAEIERRIKEIDEIGTYLSPKGVLTNLLCHLDTLEVKEVDLTKEIKNVQRKYKTIDEYENYPCTMYANSIEWIARHFFELGIKAQQ